MREFMKKPIEIIQGRLVISRLEIHIMNEVLFILSAFYIQLSVSLSTGGFSFTQ